MVYMVYICYGHPTVDQGILGRQGALVLAYKSYNVLGSFWLDLYGLCGSLVSLPYYM